MQHTQDGSACVTEGVWVCVLRKVYLHHVLVNDCIWYASTVRIVSINSNRENEADRETKAKLAPAQGKNFVTNAKSLRDGTRITPINRFSVCPRL